MNRAALGILAIVFFNTSFIVFAWVGARCGGVHSGLRSVKALTILIAGTLLQLAVAAIGGSTPSAIASMSAVTVCAATDAATGFVFDAVTLPACAGIIALASFHHELYAATTGALAAGGAMLILYGVTFGRGLGLGDVKLACCVGAALGANDALLALAVAFIAGGIYASFLLLTRRSARRDAVAFGPYIAVGTAALTLYRVW
jgi:prepilin signal peptidase PulO-like enzyme (type II secretory pathway)